MLKRLVNEIDQCKLLVLQDSIHQRDDSLLYTCLHARLKQSVKIEVFLFEHSVKEVQKALNINENTENIKFHDFFSDSNFWMLSHESPDETSHGNLLHSKVYLKNGAQRIIVSDSLCAFGLKPNNVGHELSVLNNLKIISQVIILVHKELVSEEMFKTLNYLAQATVSPWSTPSFTPRVDSSGINDICQIVYKKPSGKMYVQKELYSIKNKYELESKIWNPIVNDEIAENTNDKSHDVTFNLHLTHNEKTQKDKLVLPYTKIIDDHNSAKIYYEPDEVDDFDDEDPDEDLEI